MKHGRGCGGDGPWGLWPAGVSTGRERHYNSLKSLNTKHQTENNLKYLTR